MAQKTQATYKKQTFAGSVAAGLGSIFKGGGKKYYILEHKITSKYHKAGEWQEIIVDNIELGRSSKCQVQFDETFATVSARHAAIVKEGDNWKLVQLSQTNSTLLNGHKVEKEWYLQNGDEIQLSVNGPKLGFIIPTGAKSTVGTIGLTRRLSLFRQQALKPYKTAISIVCAVLLLSVGGLSAYSYYQKDIIDDQGKKIGLLDDVITRQQSEIADLLTTLDTQDKHIKDLMSRNEEYKKKLTENKEEMENLKNGYEDVIKQLKNARAQIDAQNKKLAQINDPGEMAKVCNPYTYAIYQTSEVITLNGQVISQDNKESHVGTGFLLHDGKFVTARHVVECWYYYKNLSGDDARRMQLYNGLAHAGCKITVSYKAVSSSGDVITFKNTEMKYDKSTDAPTGTVNFQGQELICYSPTSFSTDWATINVSHSGGFAYNKEMSVNLKAGTKLYVLGFPLSRGAENQSRISPIYSSCEVARAGLDVNGTIMVSDDDTQPGNSGGPVFVKDNGKYIIVGILSGSTAAKGRLTPIRVIQ